VFTNLEQPRNKEYITDTFNHIHKKVKRSHEKSKHKSQYPSIGLFGVVINIFNAKSTSLHDLGIVSRDDLAKLTSSFKDSLIIQFQQTLQKFRRQCSKEVRADDGSKDLPVLSIIDALTLLKFDPRELTEMREDAQVFADIRKDSHLGVSKRLETFMSSHEEEALAVGSLPPVKRDVSTIQGRQSVIDKTFASIEGLHTQARLKLLKKALSDLTGVFPLETLLSIRQIIISIEGKLGANKLVNTSNFLKTLASIKTKIVTTAVMKRNNPSTFQPRTLYFVAIYIKQQESDSYA
jgi:hypothetical protein